MPDNYVKLDEKTYVKIPDEVAALPKAQIRMWIDEKMGGQKSVSERAKENLNPQGPKAVENERIIQAAAQDEKNLYGRFAKDAALAGAAGLAAPFTGGASVPAAMAIAGAAGLAGGVAGTAAQQAIGSNEVPKTPGEIAKSLAFDSATFALGEGGGRLLGYVGKTLFPKMLVQTAAQSEAGKVLLKDAYTKTSRQLYQEIGDAALRIPPNEAAAQSATRTLVRRFDGPPLAGYIEGKIASGAEADLTGMMKGSWFTEVEKPLKNFYDKLDALPKMKSALGEQFGGLTPRAREAVTAIESELRLTGGEISQQELPGVIRAFHSLQKAAYDTGLSTEEGTIFRETVKDLRGVINRELAQVGPKAQALFKEANTLVETEMKNSIAADLSRKGVTMLAKRLLLPGIGAGYGYYSGGGSLTGALAGAGAGLLAPEAATFFLRQTMKHPVGAALMKRAVTFAVEGKGEKAGVLAARAMAVAGVRETMRRAVDQTGE